MPCFPAEICKRMQAENFKNKVILVKEALSNLSKQQYSIEELTKKPPPEGVDPQRLEDYLSDQDFKVRRGAVRSFRRFFGAYVCACEKSS